MKPIARHLKRERCKPVTVRAPELGLEVLRLKLDAGWLNRPPPQTEKNNTEHMLVIQPDGSSSKGTNGVWEYMKRFT